MKERIISEAMGCAAVYNPDRPERMIVYKRAFVEHVATDWGFKVERVLPGFWSKSEGLGC
jgi:hypothetical protein